MGCVHGERSWVQDPLGAYVTFLISKKYVINNWNYYPRTWVVYIGKGYVQEKKIKEKELLQRINEISSNLEIPKTL